MTTSPDRGDGLPFEQPIELTSTGDERAGRPPSRDQAARDFAIDPRNNVVLEASAGTGKTSVLVARYLALLDAGVDPAHILAITFTRKAAAEMRDRIIGELRRRAAQSADGGRRWRQLRDRLGDVSIGTIDAFCLSLLGEFPLEADLDPGFSVADPTETAVLLEQSLDEALGVARARADTDAGLRLVVAQMSQRRLRRGLAHLIDRRAVAGEILARVAARVPSGFTLETAVTSAAARLSAALTSAPGGVLALANDRPPAPRFDLLRADIETVVRGDDDRASLRAAITHLREYFVRQDGRPRKRPHGVLKREFPSTSAWDRHTRALEAVAPAVAAACAMLDRDTNLALVSGLRHLHATAVHLYQRALDDHDVVDFTEALARTVALLANMDEFSQSRFRLQARYHHVLVDELQDTSRLQWRLVSLLVAAWGEGLGLADEAAVPPSIFVVGDRKQSIYRFRDADVTLLQEAARFIGSLRPAGAPRRAIVRSFRAQPELLAFVNDVCEAMAASVDRPDAFRYGSDDRFPLDDEAEAGAGTPGRVEPAVGVVVTSSEEEAARAIAGEIARLLDSATVRDRETGVSRPARPGDIAVLFRARESHRVLERALETLAIPAYVYKGLGFFESPEIQDLAALIRFLARPASPIRLAALLRSRLVSLSDAALLRLSHDLVAAVFGGPRPEDLDLDERDRRTLTLLRPHVRRWVSQVDLVAPATLVDDILRETAYDIELEGPRARQARENVKKLQALVRRLQNRGYLTMSRLSEHLARLSAGDESNAIVDALDAVNLMTVHAAKGLEFPVVFLADLGRGTGAGPAIRLLSEDASGEPAVIVEGFRSDAEERYRQAEQEEAKRLLYVGMTRARDRLYLAGTVRHGRLVAGRGSLVEVMPRGLTVALADAAAHAPGEFAWQAMGGHAHRMWRVAT